MIFNSPTTLPALKILALNSAIDYYHNHWTTKILQGLNDFSIYNWKPLYQALLQKVKESPSPHQAQNPALALEHVQLFSQLFDKLPEKEKKRIATQPLNPDCQVPHWTCPLFYVLFAGDFETLQKIETYLEDQDWLAKGPEDSTFAHCFIAGIELNCHQKQTSAKCLITLLTKFPQLKHATNGWGSTPLYYLNHVIYCLEEKMKGKQELESTLLYCEQIQSLLSCG